MDIFVITGKHLFRDIYFSVTNIPIKTLDIFFPFIFLCLFVCLLVCLFLFFLHSRADKRLQCKSKLHLHIFELYKYLLKTELKPKSLMLINILKFLERKVIAQLTLMYVKRYNYYYYISKNKFISINFKFQTIKNKVS